MRLKSTYRCPKLCELGNSRGFNANMCKNGKTGLTDAEERMPSLNTVCACAYRWVHAAVRVGFLRATTMCLCCLAGAAQMVRMYEIHALVQLLVEYPAL